MYSCIKEENAVCLGERSMFNWWKRFIGIIIFSLTIVLSMTVQAQGIKRGLSVMVLGSGGPVAHRTGRASAGYLIFVDRKPRILMDAGGGTYQRLAASGTNIKDLELVLLSHLHIDHTSDLSSIIKTMYFHNRKAKTFRTAPIHIVGPGENGKPFPPILKGATKPQYPSTSEYIDGHYDLNSGVQRYLHIFTRAISGGVFQYTTQDMIPDVKQPIRTVYNKDGLVIKTIGVVHGPVPSLAYRIEYKGKSLVYSGDTSSKTHNMIQLAQGADMLIYDTAIMDDIPNGPKDKVFFALHTKPSRIGQVASAAKVKRLVLSHITPITGARLNKVKQKITAQGYRGRIEVAYDNAIYNLH